MTLPPKVKQEVHQALRETGLSYDTVQDLCELAARKAPLLTELAGAAAHSPFLRCRSTA